MPTIQERIDSLAWPQLHAELDARGYACIPDLLRAGECQQLRSLYADERHFRSRVVMARHGFGRGEYQYFAQPLAETVAQLRAASYPQLVPIANAWSERLKQARHWPATLEGLHEECRALGQTRPTPLLLKYGPDDYNCMHQDLYGELVFPLQLAVLLSEPGEDFSGGEFILLEQRPRMQSRAEVVPLSRGDGVIFAVQQRPATGVRGSYRVNLRHGVSRVRSGERFTLGVIFHDAV
jgi:uncharacterized protein